MIREKALIAIVQRSLGAARRSNSEYGHLTFLELEDIIVALLSSPCACGGLEPIQGWASEGMATHNQIEEALAKRTPMGFSIMLQPDNKYDIPMRFIILPGGEE